MTDSTKRLTREFAPAVLEAFEFLGDRGFKVAETSIDRVRYESSSVTVTVWIDPLGDILCLEVGRVSSPRARASSRAMEEVSGFRPSPAMRPANRAEMQRDANQLSEILSYVDPRFLRGDLAAFEEVAAEAMRQTLGTSRA